ncbi:MAG: TonB-dependent receptor, partial [Polyangiales bacterium]
LALLATPPEEPEAPPAPPPPPEVPVTPEPPAPAPAPPPPPVVAQPTPEPALRLRVAGALGAAWNAGRAFFVQRAELDLRVRRLVIGLRGDWGARDDGGEELRAHSYGLAARWLTPVGRWELELGAVFAAAGLRTEIERGNTDRRTAWSLRAGVDLGAALRLTRALSAFVRVEGLARLARLSDGPAPSGSSPLSVSASLGLRLEVAP